MSTALLLDQNEKCSNHESNLNEGYFIAFKIHNHNIKKYIEVMVNMESNKQCQVLQ